MDIHQIDFADSEEITGFAELLCQNANKAGMLLPGCRNTAAVSHLRSVARDWVREIDRRIDRMPAAVALEVICVYDYVHRVAYGQPAYSDFISRYVMKAFDAMARGDKSVDIYTVFRQIVAGFKRKDKLFFGRPLQWYSNVLDRWHKEFQYGNAPFGMTPYDTLQRVTILLESDLYVFEGSNEENYKETLFAAHRHYLTDLLHNPEIFNTEKSLKALNRFLTLSLSYIDYSDYERYKEALTDLLHPHRLASKSAS